MFQTQDREKNEKGNLRPKSIAHSFQHTDESGWNDIGIREISSRAWDMLWY